MNYFIVVDGFISGNAIAYELTRRGHRCIHLYSSEAIFHERFRDNASVYYDDVFIWSSSLDDIDNLTISRIRSEYNIVGAVAGSDTGVQVADAINRMIRSPFKNSEFNRRDRRKVVLSLGEPAYSCDEIYEAFKKHELVVKKPIFGAGGCDRVTVHKKEELNSIYVNSNMFLMPYYTGQEYAVDMVSCEGKHRICGVWKYEKYKEDLVWRNRVTLVDPIQHPDLIMVLYEYVSNALHETGYNNGASHTEVMLTTDGPRLIEVNYRNNGHMDLSSIKAAIHPRCQIDLLADALTDPDNFQGKATYVLKEHITRVYFLNHEKRPYSAINWLAIRRHPGVAQVYEHVRPFEDVPVSTFSYRGVAAIIIMRGPDKQILDQQENELRTFLAQY